MAKRQPTDEASLEPRGNCIRLNGFGSVTVLLGTRTARSILRGAHGLIFGDGERPQLDEDAIVADLRFAERTGLLRNETRPRLESRPSDSQEDEWADATPLISLAQTWVAIELVDVDDHPVVGARYEIRSGDGQLFTGQTDEHGRAYLDGIPAKECEVSFPDLDRKVWAQA